MRIEVEEGDIEVKSLYVVRCELSVGRGAVRLGQVHQSVNVNVKEEGSIDIGGFLRIGFLMRLC